MKNYHDYREIRWPRASENYSNVFSFPFFLCFSFPFLSGAFVWFSSLPTLSLFISLAICFVNLLLAFTVFIFIAGRRWDIVVVKYHHVTRDTRWGLIGREGARRLDRVHVEVVGPASRDDDNLSTKYYLVSCVRRRLRLFFFFFWNRCAWLCLFNFYRDTFFYLDTFNSKLPTRLQKSLLTPSILLLFFWGKFAHFYPHLITI